MLNTPILLLIFNRPDTTKKVFEAIREQRPKYLYVASDGPRSDNHDDIDLCRQCIDITSNIDWPCEVKTLLRDTNLGCGLGPATAITWFFDHVDQGIILEDDVFPDQSFFYFCEQMLERYKHDHRMMHISGCYFLEAHGEPSLQSYYFTKHIHVWGWASWKRAWKLYDYKMKDLSILESNERLSKYYGGYSIFWKDIFRGMKNRGDDIWDYQWMFSIYKNDGIAINPTINLTKNIGFNSNATHTKNPESVFTKIKLSSLSEIIPPVANNIDTEKDILYYKYFLEFDLQAELKKRNTIWRIKGLLRKLKIRFREFLK